MRTPLAFLLLGAALAGCVDDGKGPAAAPPSYAAARHAGVPPIDWDVDAAIDWWEDIATNYPKHDSYSPTNAMLRERLVADLEALGLEVEQRQYLAGYTPPRLPSPVPPLPPEVPRPTVQVPDTEHTRLHAIIATKPGLTMPDHRIGLVSHYDTQAFTIHGAYDDASGVAADFHICKALLQVPMDRTLACIFFDGEEQGLVASREYVRDVVLEGDEGYVYDFVLGYDMTGINFPGHDWKMYAMAGELWGVPGDADSAEVSPMYGFAQDLLHGVLGYPYEGVEVLDHADRNSDERRFKEAGVPILRFAGGRHAADYDQYHKPLDTVEHVYEVTGGRANFAAGFATIVEASYATVLALDRTSLAQMADAYGYELPPAAV